MTLKLSTLLLLAVLAPAAALAAGPGPLFVRSDQVHLGRAPMNTKDFSKLLSENFSSPDADAKTVIARLKEKPSPFPVYLGNVHSWVWISDPNYRKNVQQLVMRVANATGERVLVYFEEQNATVRQTRVPERLAAELRALSRKATLLMATYANGPMSREQVRELVERFHDWYHRRLKIRLNDMMIDVDTSQTPGSFYYGTRGDLENFNRVVGWALKAAHDRRFGGFHTMGNAGSAHGTQVAADSTYQALDRGWKELVAAHPGQVFSGIRPR